MAVDLVVPGSTDVRVGGGRGPRVARSVETGPSVPVIDEYVALVTADGATDLWLMNDSADLGHNSISSRHATLVGNTTHTATGPFDTGGAAALDGSGDYLNVADDNAFSTTNMTIEIWARGTALSGMGAQATLINKDAATAAQEWALTLSITNTGVFNALTKNTNQTNHRRLYSNEAWMDGQWHHYAFTFDGTTATPHIYVDGVNRDANPNNGGTRAGNTSAPVTIGARGNGTLSWPGDMFGAAYYPVVLSESQIAAHAAFAPPTTAITDPTDLDGCVCWADAATITGVTDGDEFTVWPDSSGSGNHLSGGGSLARYRATGGPTGGPSVEFEADDAGNGLHAFRFLEGGFINIAQATTFVVFKPDTLTGEHFVVAARDSGSSNDRWYVARQVDDDNTFFQGGSAAFVTHADVLTTGWHVSSLRGHGFRVIAKTDATETDTVLNASIADVFTNVARVGWVATSSVGHFDGRIAEIIHYNRALSDTERSAVEAYLEDKYGITL